MASENSGHSGPLEMHSEDDIQVKRQVVVHTVTPWFPAVFVVLYVQDEGGR